MKKLLLILTALLLSSCTSKPVQFKGDVFITGSNGAVNKLAGTRVAIIPAEAIKERLKDPDNALNQQINAVAAEDAWCGKQVAAFEKQAANAGHDSIDAKGWDEVKRRCTSDVSVPFVLSKIAEPLPPNTVSAATNADGRFEVDVPAGSYYIYAVGQENDELHINPRHPWFEPVSVSETNRSIILDRSNTMTFARINQLRQP